MNGCLLNNKFEGGGVEGPRSLMRDSTPLVEALRTSPKVAGSIPDILQATLCPWGRLSVEQKLGPEIFPGGKGGRCVGLTT